MKKIVLLLIIWVININFLWAKEYSENEVKLEKIKAEIQLLNKYDEQSNILLKEIEKIKIEWDIGNEKILKYIDLNFKYTKKISEIQDTQSQIIDLIFVRLELESEILDSIDEKDNLSLKISEIGDKQLWYQIIILYLLIFVILTTVFSKKIGLCFLSLIDTFQKITLKYKWLSEWWKIAIATSVVALIIMILWIIINSIL